MSNDLTDERTPLMPGAEKDAPYRRGDIAVVDGRVAVYMPTRWEWMDGTWTAIPLNVGPILGNVYDVATRVFPPGRGNTDAEH